ncbi:hypothetical protein [Paraliobacillus ryukyuensis]|uniref:hypothetical protein n=1 Tax=Paraliobacillus ryukyuensis TaxID=200904 RepID=UPI0009A6CC63|nr:hypothetical protein [Paraliobacillus ryukyuensis]
MAKINVLSKHNLDTYKKKDKFYIENHENQTLIEVSKSVVKVLNKINNLPNGVNHVLMDVLAPAIYKRRLENIDRVVTDWENETLKEPVYPLCKANVAFDKLISTLIRELCPKEINDKEEQAMIHFFANGYDASRLIHAHIELKPVIT